MLRRFVYQPVLSQLHDLAILDQLVGPYLERLANLGGERLLEGTPQAEIPLVWLVATGGTERQLLRLLDQYENGGAAPVILIAHPGHNSLAASLEVLAALQQRGTPGRIVFFNGPEDQRASKGLLEAVQELDTNRRLRSMRLGLLGSPSEWLVASSPPHDVLRNTWGPTVHTIQIDELRRALSGMERSLVEAETEELLRGASQVVEPQRQQLIEAAQVSLALRRIVEQQGLDAVTVRCFDLVVEEQVTACFALARLNEAGIIAGCEGDLVSTLGMAWTNTLLGVLPWMANVALADEPNDLLWLAHCTVPRSLVEEHTLRSHFESGLGVGIQGTFAPGPITLLRIGGARLRQLWIADATIMGSGNDEGLCRTQIEVKLEPGSVTELLQAPLGNHLVVVPGHHAERLKAYWNSYINSHLP